MLGDLGVFGLQVVEGGFEFGEAGAEAGEEAAGLVGVVEVESLADGEAVDPELGAEAGARGGDLVADQGEFAAERVVDVAERLTEGGPVRRATRQRAEGDDGDRAGGVGLVLAPAGIGLDQPGEGLVALDVT